MKKVLLASTVLAMTATVAAAEVKITGDARMGIVNGFVHAAGAADDTAFSSRARVSFSMSGETDGGLAFGASLRADNSAAAAAGLAGSVFISGAFGKLSMGDVDGAAQSAVGHVDGVGYTGIGDKNEIAFIAAGGAATPVANAHPGSVASDPTALYEYSAGSFTGYISATNPAAYNETGNVAFTSIVGGAVVVNPATGAPGKNAGDTRPFAWAVGAKYAMGDYTLSAGYEKATLKTVAGPTSSTTHFVLGADATFGQITVKARYGKASMKAAGVAAGKMTQSALSATYKMDAISVTGFVRNTANKNPAGVTTSKSAAYGIGAAYDLGGGASLKGGIVNEKLTAGAVSTNDTGFDLGVTFSF